jgi:hypothetical protein
MIETMSYDWLDDIAKKSDEKAAAARKQAEETAAQTAKDRSFTQDAWTQVLLPELDRFVETVNQRLGAGTLAVVRRDPALVVTHTPSSSTASVTPHYEGAYISVNYVERRPGRGEYSNSYFLGSIDAKPTLKTNLQKPTARTPEDMIDLLLGDWLRTVAKP